MVAHNHPSGALEPSRSEIEITGQLKAAGAIVGIDLLDHGGLTANALTLSSNLVRR